MNKLHWECLTKSDILVSEYDDEPMKNIKHIKICYFTDGDNYYGIKNNLMFFVNQMVIDLKLKQRIIDFFQYKTDEFDLFTNMMHTKYQIGMNTTDDNYKYKYTMVIDDPYINIIAEKYDNDKKIDEKIMKVM